MYCVMVEIRELLIAVNRMGVINLAIKQINLSLWSSKSVKALCRAYAGV